MKGKKAFTVTDLGPGDGGKGGVVHKLCIEHDAHTVLKVGGAQGSHGVRTSHGQSFNFSQFGCGTFEGVPTHVTNLMVIEPLGLVAEGNSLRYEKGVPEAFDLITVNRDCLCTTPFHRIASRLRELARKGNQKGTIGVGVGEAKLDSELHPELAIYVRDIGKSDLRDKLEAVRQQKLVELASIIENVRELWPADHEIAAREIGFLLNPDTVGAIAEGFENMKAQVALVDAEYLEKEILQKDGAFVVESSHGVLTDRYHGFHPYTSRLRTLPMATLNLLKEHGYDGEVVKYGVHRAYAIRHGAGPLVTESPELLGTLLPGSSKDENRWQGKVRVGALDLVALRYAIAVCADFSPFDALAITWFDQIQTAGSWSTCDRYNGATESKFFWPDGEIRTSRHWDEDDEQLKRQGRLSELLFACRPEVESHPLLSGEGSREHAIALC